MPRRIWIVSSVLGGSTLTLWKRRSSAASFSINLRYSSSVVAPTHWNSPRLKAGLMILATSIVPSEEPAPTMVCSSSMKMMTSPDSRISSIKALIRSSNWPRYLVPASIRARSSPTIFLLRRISGTSSSAILCARPSTIAVLPTPASPSRTGLFLVRRQRICITRWISFWRPMTGSSCLALAISVRSRPKAFRAEGFLFLLLERFSGSSSLRSNMEPLSSSI